MEFLKNTKEIRENIFSIDTIQNMFDSKACISYIYNNRTPLLLGPNMLLKVNTNIGVSDITSMDVELKKLRILSKLPYSPDSMMDHTYVPTETPLWKYMVQEFDGPIGTLPHYSTFVPDKGIDKNALLEKIEEMAEGGVSFMTLHPTSSPALFELAQTCRKVPTTSRGGAVVLKDAIINKRSNNIFADYFVDILKLFKKFNMTMSIGTTFRPARIDEALDAVQIAEIKEQKKFIDDAKNYGIQVIMEGIGHIALDQMPKYFDLLKTYNTPLMPLGPMPTDATIGFDHVTSAIGSTMAALLGNVGTINSVTREEHIGGVPTIDSIIEGLKSARVAAHCINVSRFKRFRDMDKAISDNRAANNTCAIKGGIFMDETVTRIDEGCNRCRYECPLTLLK